MAQLHSSFFADATTLPQLTLPATLISGARLIFVITIPPVVNSSTATVVAAKMMSFSDTTVSVTTTAMSSPAYFIYRDTQSETFDPSAGLQFFPPKDSDELFFALRTAYPAASTHSERMRNAVIDFLLQERDAEQLDLQSAALLPTDSTLSLDGSSTSPNSSYMSASTSSMMNSPDLFDNIPATSMVSPAGTAPSLSRTSSQEPVSYTHLTLPTKRIV